MKTKNTITALILVWFGLMIPVAQAGGASSPLAGYLEQALTANDDLRAARAAFQAETARIRQAGVLPDPRLTIQYYLQPVETADFVDIAERFLGVPYLWGGRSSYGIDCSALVQIAMQTVGLQAPRDSDMQLAELGTPVKAPLQRGDLVFWKGHVGVMRDGETLLHANAHHMAVASEPLADAQARIAAKGDGDIIGIRRLAR